MKGSWSYHELQAAYVGVRGRAGSKKAFGCMDRNALGGIYAALLVL